MGAVLRANGTDAIRRPRARTTAQKAAAGGRRPCVADTAVRGRRGRSRARLRAARADPARAAAGRVDQLRSRALVHAADPCLEAWMAALESQVIDENPVEEVVVVFVPDQAVLQERKSHAVGD